MKRFRQRTAHTSQQASSRRSSQRRGVRLTRFVRMVPIALMVSVVVPAMHPGLASASPVEQQRQRVQNIVDELERLEEDALRIGEEYTAALDDQRLLAEEIVDLEADIAAQEAELATLRSDLGEMAVRSFIGTGRAPLGPLFEESANLNDVLQRDELARAALSAGDVTTDEIDAYVADLEDDRTELENKRKQAEQLAVSLVSAQEETERLRAEYQQARIDAEAELGQLIVEEEQRRAAESAARIQAEIAASQNASNNSGSSNPGSSNPGSSNNSGSSNDSGSNNAGTTTSSGSGSSGSSGDSGSNSGGGSSAPPVSSLASVAVNAALGQQGVPYRYATSSPGVSFDCSGLTKYAWAKAGVYLPHQSAQQFASIPHVSKDAAQPGDLLFYYSPISHVGVYLGGGQLVHAPATGDVVKVASVNWSKVSGVGRPG